MDNQNNNTETEEQKRLRLRELAAKLSRDPGEADKGTDGSSAPQPPIIKVEENNFSSIDPSLARKSENKLESIEPSIERKIETKKTEHFGNKKFNKIYLILGIVILLLVIGLVYAFSSGGKEENITVAPELVTIPEEVKSEIQIKQELLDQLGELIVLPENEDPTIATVSDLSKLAGEPFFEKAQVGDKVIIYEQAQKAILFRPELNQIIELAPLFDQPVEEAPTPS